MTFPTLPPLGRGKEIEPGLGDKVEELLFIVKVSALSKLTSQPGREMSEIIKENLRAMLQSATEKDDAENADLFQKALERASRVL